MENFITMGNMPIYNMDYGIQDLQNHTPGDFLAKKTPDV